MAHSASTGSGRAPTACPGIRSVALYRPRLDSSEEAATLEWADYLRREAFLNGARLERLEPADVSMLVSVSAALRALYKETARSGLAVNIIGC
ncbi:hypothetical protein [Streptomyces sp. JW3]|uniref:hypothetical protein n=1 Tax=Streptomyces sp. JW3 TaxID=3456955 RepID=UPI003FA45508